MLMAQARGLRQPMPAATHETLIRLLAASGIRRRVTARSAPDRQPGWLVADFDRRCEPGVYLRVSSSDLDGVKSSQGLSFHQFCRFEGKC
jgi:hypothetical protein